MTDEMTGEQRRKMINKTVKVIANNKRSMLCVLACEGLTDEEVAKLVPKAKEMYKAIEFATKTLKELP